VELDYLLNYALSSSQGGTEYDFSYLQISCIANYIDLGVTIDKKTWVFPVLITTYTQVAFFYKHF